MKEKFQPLDFMKNKVIINDIVENCVLDGRIDYFMAKMYKEVYLILEYTNYVEPMSSEDGVDLVETFKLIRETGCFKKRFVKEFNLRDLTEFEELLDLELKQESELQKEEHSLGRVVETFLEEIKNKLPEKKEIEDIVNKLSQIDENKITAMNEFLSKAKIK